VKSVADKADPRFETARKKAVKEEAIRAQIDASSPDGDEELDEEPEAAAPRPTGTFTFNVPKEGDE
jgi:hypothetical protein